MVIHVIFHEITISYDFPIGKVTLLPMFSEYQSCFFSGNINENIFWIMMINGINGNMNYISNVNGNIAGYHGMMILTYGTVLFEIYRIWYPQKDRSYGGAVIFSTYLPTFQCFYIFWGYDTQGYECYFINGHWWDIMNGYSWARPFHWYHPRYWLVYRSSINITVTQAG